MNRNQISPTTLNSDLRELSQIQLLPGQIFAGEGFVPFSHLPRLLEELDLEPGEEGKLGLHWSAATSMDLQTEGLPEEYRLKISLKGSLPLQCQKCQGKLQEVVDFETQFLILETEEAVEEYPLDDDLEDVLAANPKFDLYDLIEGEALLSVPLMPAHETGKCDKSSPKSTKSVQKSSISSKSEEFDKSDKKPNPFEILKKLKLDK
jgi:uncharacterized metal-binding protein YceD (DUF177 family)